MSELLDRRPNVAVFAIFFALAALWSIATPMYGTPDEPAHMVRGAGLVRGDLDGTRTADNKIVFEVPSILASDPGCYAFKSAQPASCLDLPPDDGLTDVVSTASTNPPLFHFVIGLPTLVSSGLTSLYLMRLANGAVAAAFLTLTVANIRLLPRPGPVALGLAVAVTPMVLFLIGPANPSGIATASGLAVWTAGMVLLERDSARTVAASSAAFAVPFIAFIFVRRDSLIWGLAIAVVLLLLVTRERLVELLKQRSFVAWSSLVALAAIVQYVVWSGDNAEGFSAGASSSGGGDAAMAFGRSFTYMVETIARFGWLDTAAPTVVYYGWIFALGLGALATLGFGRPKEIVAYVGAVVIAVALLTYIGSIRFPYFQGRYFLPFVAGIPLLAGWAWRRSGHRFAVPPRLVAVGLSVLWLLHQLAFLQHLRRYAVGSKGTFNFLFDNEWSPPPAPMWLIVLAYFAASAALMMLFARFVIGPWAGSDDQTDDRLVVGDR